RYSYSVAFRACMKINNYEQAIQYLELAVRNQEYNSSENLLYNLSDYGLDTTKKYQQIADNYDDLYYSWEYTLNPKAIKMYDEIYIADQHIRNLYNATIDV